MTVQSRSRVTGVATFVAAFLAVGALASACIDTKRGLGEECLKDDECLSGVCRGLTCASTGPVLAVGPGGAVPEKDAGGFEAAAAETSTDASAPVDAADGG